MDVRSEFGKNISVIKLDLRKKIGLNGFMFSNKSGNMFDYIHFVFMDESNLPSYFLLKKTKDEQFQLGDILEKIRGFLQDEIYEDRNLRELPFSIAVRQFGLDGGNTDISRMIARDFIDFAGSKSSEMKVALQRSDIRSEILRQEAIRIAGLPEILEFMSRLDADALEALSGAGEWGDAAYYWLTGAMNDDARKYRFQAARSFPLLAGSFAKASMSSLARKIDRAEPIDQDLRDRFSISGKGPAKRMRKIVWGPKSRDPEEALKWLTMIPPDWIPGSAEQWSAFLDVAPGIFGYLVDTSRQPIDVVLAGCGGDWVGFRRRILEALEMDQEYDALDPLEDPAWASLNIENACRSLADMVHDFGNAVILPLAANLSDLKRCNIGPVQSTAVASYAASYLYSGKAAPAILDASRRWHIERNRLSHFRQDYSEIGSWPALFNTVMAPNGVVFVPLLTAEDLAEESSRLSHYVRGYTNACLTGNTHIFSARQGDSTGQSLATLELRTNVLSRDRADIHSAQYRSFRNRVPGPDAMDAHDWLMSRIGKEIHLNIGSIESFDYVAASQKQSKNDHRQVLTDHAYKLCGYNWRSKREIYRSWKAWTGVPLNEDFQELPPDEHGFSYLSKQQRKAGISLFVKDAGFLDLVRTINPDISDREIIRNSNRMDEDEVRANNIAIPA